MGDAELPTKPGSVIRVSPTAEGQPLVLGVDGLWHTGDWQTKTPAEVMDGWPDWIELVPELAAKAEAWDEGWNSRWDNRVIVRHPDNPYRP